MTSAVLTPYSTAEASKSGPRLWRKRLLPIGTINYEGREIEFDRDYLAQLADSFYRRCYDQVPFQLADRDNKHNNDPQRTRGEIAAMSVEPDGLWVTLSTTDAGSQILENNPRLGVSARIVEDYSRSDGRSWPAPIQHVLGTLDPRG